MELQVVTSLVDVVGRNLVQLSQLVGRPILAVDDVDLKGRSIPATLDEAIKRAVDSSPVLVRLEQTARMGWMVRRLPQLRRPTEVRAVQAVRAKTAARGLQLRSVPSPAARAETAATTAATDRPVWAEVVAQWAAAAVPTSRVARAPMAIRVGQGLLVPTEPQVQAVPPVSRLGRRTLAATYPQMAATVSKVRTVAVAVVAAVVAVAGRP